MVILGLSGYARSGKDEVAKILVAEHGYTRVAFADKLRDVLYALDPVVNPTPEKYFSGGRLGPKRLQDVIAEFGWDGYKESQYKDEIRRLLQRLGTEAGRQTLWDSIWIDAAFANVPPDAKVVVTDCRFVNEADAIRERGGLVVRIHRPGVKALNDHASETSLDAYNFDAHIHNDGTLEDLRQKVNRAILDV